MATVLVCGGRRYMDYERVYAVMNRVLDALNGAKLPMRLIHGACNVKKPYTRIGNDPPVGADAIAHRWAGYQPQASTPKPPKSKRRLGRRQKYEVLFGIGYKHARPVCLNEHTVQAWGRALFGTIRDQRNLPVFRYIFGSDFFAPEQPVLPFTKDTP